VLVSLSGEMLLKELLLKDGLKRARGDLRVGGLKMLILEVVYFFGDLYR
jgi:hypothetical protein